jgi:hypothetical protein
LGIKVFYLPTYAQENCFKKNIKIYIKTAPTCFGAATPSSGSALFELPKVIFVKVYSEQCTTRTHQKGPNNIRSHTTELTTPMYLIHYFNNYNFSKLK